MKNVVAALLLVAAASAQGTRAASDHMDLRYRAVIPSPSCQALPAHC